MISQDFRLILKYKIIRQKYDQKLKEQSYYNQLFNSRILLDVPICPLCESHKLTQDQVNDRLIEIKNDLHKILKMLNQIRQKMSDNYDELVNYPHLKE